MENDGVAVVGAGRIGTPLLYFLLKLGVPVSVISEIPNLGGKNTIDTLVETMNGEDMARGRLPWEVGKLGNDILGINLNGNSYKIKLITPTDPSERDWKKDGIHFVQEASGKCLTRYSKDLKKEELSEGQYGADVHFNNGAHTVIVSAPTKGEDGTFVYGINEGDYNPTEHKFISNSSCTTKAVAFPLAVLYDNGINTIGNIVIATTHAATGPTLVKLKKPNYNAREGEIEEASSGAYSALSKIFNKNGVVKLHGCEAYALRVPTLNGSVASVQIEIDDGKVTAEDINNMFRKAASDPRYQKGIDIYEGKEPFHSHLVSSQGLYKVSGHIPSSVISLKKTFEIGFRGRRFDAWYNNEDAPPLNQAQFTKYSLERRLSERRAA